MRFCPARYACLSSQANPPSRFENCTGLPQSPGQGIHMKHLSSGLERQASASCALSARIPSTSADRRVLAEKQAGAEWKGGKNMHHSAHQTRGSAFLNPCLARLLPPLPSSTQPPLATLGHASRLCMTARNIPCHKMFSQSIYFRDPISR
ncbi:hypothetical protein NQZ68_013243 [Dissostichus eleginoides]|nr:hypothetical protein NQZ68_013243 [Dissostichus eleginoides]